MPKTVLELLWILKYNLKCDKKSNNKREKKQNNSYPFGNQSLISNKKKERKPPNKPESVSQSDVNV